jgi:acetolactate synthase regulatory subunit
MQNTHLHLKITVRQNRTVLPRCLQLVSRRGFVLKALLTQQRQPAIAQLHCTLYGPTRWHGSIPLLLNKTTDVLAVERIEDNE